jgi:hypothetical protein
MALCWKCRDGFYNVKPLPFTHCHHDEPEEKPTEKPKEKCWCEYDFPERPKVISIGAFGFGFTHWDIVFCPICGRKL